MSQNSYITGALQTESPATWLEWERLEGRSSIFKPLDEWLGTLWMRFWKGERLCETEFPKGEPARIVLVGLDTKARHFIDETFSLSAQQSRGALYHPTKESLRQGIANFGWYQTTLPRFALGAALEERGTALLGSEGGDAIALWSVVQEMFAPVLVPFSLRGGDWEMEDARKAWQEWEQFCVDVGFEVDEEAAPFRPDVAGGRLWASWTMEQQLAARARLWEAMRRTVTPGMAARPRAQMLRKFVARYAEKTRKSPNTRKRVLSKEGERLLSGLFGGDWLRALEYLGEKAHAEETVVTALPQTRLYVGMEGRVAEVAAQSGLPEAEVRLMVEGFWDGTTGSSPIERRVACLERFWAEFEVLHDRQAPGMTPLWGLVADWKGLDLPLDRNTVNEEPPQESEYVRPLPYHPGLYREKLSPSLQRDIEECWQTTLLPRFPDKMATSLNPHYTLASALGVALRLWHGCSLTAWFLCEGPMSRTDLEGMPFYYRKQLDELEKMGMPVDESLFKDLQVAGKKLGPEKPIITREEKTEFVTFTTSFGNRRDGFELLRDVITRHRKLWTQQHLTAYLKSRWEVEVREAANAYTHQLHAAGKAPTAKAFAKTALVPSNHWFGGDLSGFFRTIGEKSPVSPTYTQLMPRDAVAFALRVRRRLKDHEELRGLRDEPAYYVQLEEVLGYAPEAKDVTAGKNDFVSSALKNEPKLWTAFEAAIRAEMTA